MLEPKVFTFDLCPPPAALERAHIIVADLQRVTAIMLVFYKQAEVGIYKRKQVNKKTRTRPRKRSRKQENKKSTKKVIKKARKNERKHALDQEKKKNFVSFCSYFLVFLYI